MTTNLEALDVQLAEITAPVVARCAEAWEEPYLSERLTIVLGRNLYRSLGRCYPERSLVRIARSVLTLPGPIQQEVVCHEVAHLVAFERHGRDERPHGTGWKGLMHAAGFEARVRIYLEPDAAAVRTALARDHSLFEHRCPVCQQRRLARRRMTQWRCRDCVTAGLDGLLVISSRSGTELAL